MVFFMKNLRREKQVQSGLEYLMTYGWGIVVVAVIIAALVLIANPGLIKSGSFSGFKQNMAVVNARYPSSPTDSIQLIVSNVSGRSIKLSALVVKDATGQTINGSATIDDQPIPNQIILAGSQKTITFALNSGGSWPAGSSSLSVDIIGTDNDNFSKNSTGTLSFALPQSAASCGNGIIESGEGCDDGGQQGGDGCDSTCHVESGWQCFGQPSVCYQELSACGNPPGGSWVNGRKYVLKTDVSTLGTCFTIDTSNVWLDCKGKTITASTGIAVTSGQWQQVQDCAINAVTKGIQIGDMASGATVKNNTINVTGNLGTRYGVQITTGSIVPVNTNNTVQSNVVSFTKLATTNRAIFVHQNARNNLIKENTLVCNGFGGTYSIEVEQSGRQDSLSGNNTCPDFTCSGPSPVCNSLNCDFSC